MLNQFATPEEEEAARKAHADAIMAIAMAFDRTFSRNDGPTVLDHLEVRFRAQRIYQAGGTEGQRETDRRAAQKEVVDYILSMISRAQQGDPNE